LRKRECENIVLFKLIEMPIHGTSWQQNLYESNSWTLEQTFGYGVSTHTNNIKFPNFSTHKNPQHPHLSSLYSFPLDLYKILGGGKNEELGTHFVQFQFWVLLLIWHLWDCAFFQCLLPTPLHLTVKYIEKHSVLWLLLPSSNCRTLEQCVLTITRTEWRQGQHYTVQMSCICLKLLAIDRMQPLVKICVTDLDLSCLQCTFLQW